MFLAISSVSIARAYTWSLRKSNLYTLCTDSLHHTICSVYYSISVNYLQKGSYVCPIEEITDQEEGDDSVDETYEPLSTLTMR